MSTLPLIFAASDIHGGSALAVGGSNIVSLWLQPSRQSWPSVRH
jgi:hypothetical protein